MEAYEGAIPKVKFSGPIKFSPVIKEAAGYVETGHLVLDVPSKIMIKCGNAVWVYTHEHR